MKMQIYSQRDHRWAEDHLGASTLTVGRYGCTTTCLSMLCSYFGCVVLPSAIAHNAHNYTPDGLILWPNLNFTCMEFVERFYGEQREKIDAALKDPNRAVMLQVDNRQHWVVATGKTKFGFGSDYNIADPWWGDRRTAKGSYKNITGGAIFKRK